MSRPHRLLLVTLPFRELTPESRQVLALDESVELPDELLLLVEESDPPELDDPEPDESELDDPDPDESELDDPESDDPESDDPESDDDELESDDFDALSLLDELPPDRESLR